MAVGTTFRPNITRNDLVRRALQKVRAIKKGETADGDLMRDGIYSLNDILREEDNEQTGQKRFLMSLKVAHLLLQEEKPLYTVADGLPGDIHELHSVHRVDTSSDISPVDFISPKQWEALASKTDTGDVEKVYLQVAQDPANHQLHVWPRQAIIGTTSEVAGTDTLSYKCILNHTAASDNKPITGTSWPTYWALLGTSAAVWATGTAYTHGGSLRLLYKRPLFNFDTVDDDPDLPDGWSSYLLWRLCEYLSPENDVKSRDRQFFTSMAAKAAQRLFPTHVAKTTDFHNRALYF